MGTFSVSASLISLYLGKRKMASHICHTQKKKNKKNECVRCTFTSQMIHKVSLIIK